MFIHTLFFSLLIVTKEFIVKTRVVKFLFPLLFFFYISFDIYSPVTQHNVIALLDFFFFLIMALHRGRKQTKIDIDDWITGSARGLTL